MVVRAMEQGAVAPLLPGPDLVGQPFRVERRAARSTVRTRAGVLMAAAAGAVATGLVVAVPGLHFAYRNPDLHVALLTTQALIAMLCAYLLVGRLSRSAALDDLFLCL